MKYGLISLIILGINSCGLKITNEIDENLLLGTWNLNELRCYLSVASNSYVERYEFDSVTDFDTTLKIEGQNVQYTVSSNTCTTSATAVYAVNYDGSLSGKVDFVQVVSGSTCDYTMAFTGSTGAGSTGVIKLAMLSTYSKDLDWTISSDKETLTLDFFTNFKGSDNTSYCSEICYCQGIYTKASSGILDNTDL